MAKKYEYWTTKDGEDLTIQLEVVSFTSTKGNFSSQASDPEEYYGSQEIEWRTEDDVDWMSTLDVQQMEEWLVNEHSEYLADQDYYD